jgi:hypothetical protein
VAICSVVVFALFFYVFNDFLNVEIKDLSSAMRDTFGAALAIVFALTASLFAGRKIHQEKNSPDTLFYSARFLGESQKVLRQYWMMRKVTIISAFYLPTFYLIQNYLYKLDRNLFISTLLIMFITSFLSFVSTPDKSNDENKQTKLLDSGKLSPLKTMSRWRLQLILKRNRLAQVCLILSFSFVGLLALISFKQIPSFVGFLASFMAGMLIAAAISFQISDDLKYSWIEKNLGVSHELYIQMLKRISLVLASLLCFSITAAWLSPKIFSATGILPSALIETIKFSFSAMTPLWILPHVVFQIDGRKPIIQLATVLLIGLFIGTAIFANLLAILLLPIFSYYAEQSQHGHFYRA